MEGSARDVMVGGGLIVLCDLALVGSCIMSISSCFKDQLQWVRGKGKC